LISGAHLNCSRASNARVESVFAQQYEVVQGEIQRVKIHATGSGANPHDVDAQRSAKKEKRCLGYKVQVPETIAEDPERGQEPEGRFITSLVTQKAH
jgi:hypothetical protein